MNTPKFFGIIILLVPLFLHPRGATGQSLTIIGESASQTELRDLFEEKLPDASPIYVQTIIDTPREDFIPEHFRPLAQANIDVPVAHDAIVPSPLLALTILYETGIRPGLSVLIIGKGTGYLGALAASITENVTILEFSRELLISYTEIFTDLHIDNATLVNTYAGAAEAGFMYDVVIVHGGTPSLLPEISSFLRPSGILVVPLAGESGYQNLLKIQYGNGLRISSMGESFFPLVEELYRPY